MFDFVHHDLGQRSSGEIVQVELANRANVQLVDSDNLRKYRSGSQYRYIGGQALRSPLRLEIPYSGHWHVVVDLGGAAGTIRSSVRVYARAA